MVTLTDRERIIAIEPREMGMVGMRLRYSHEVEDSNRCFEGTKDIKVTKDMLELATHIVETKSGSFDPDKFADYQGNAFIKLLTKKQESLPTASEPLAAGGNVISLMGVLRKSLLSKRK